MVVFFLRYPEVLCRSTQMYCLLWLFSVNMRPITTHLVEQTNHMNNGTETLKQGRLTQCLPV